MVGQTGVKVDPTSAPMPIVVRRPMSPHAEWHNNLPVCQSTNSGTVPLIRHGLTLQQSGATMVELSAYTVTIHQFDQYYVDQQIWAACDFGPFTLAAELNLTTLYTGTTADG